MDTIWTLKDYATERQVDVPGSAQNYTVRFAAMQALLCAARELADLYDQWDSQHLGYADVDRDAFLFDSRTGRMTFRDDKKIVGRSLALSEKQRIAFYSAPELILGETETLTSESQNWTLAMLLFDLFYHGGHPLSGASSFANVFYSPEQEYLWYASDGIFNMEEFTCRNRPVYGIQGYLIRYWNYYPQVLQDAFTEVFLYGKEDRTRRLSPGQWKRILNDVSSALPCDCGYGGFIQTYITTENGNYRCPRCGKIYYALGCRGRNIYISNGTSIRRCQLDPERPDDREEVAVVVENRQIKGIYGVKNTSDDIWVAVFPDQSRREVAKNQGVPVWPGLSITLPRGDVWHIDQKTEKNNE